jgi:D-amino-acid dehydrogenase
MGRVTIIGAGIVGVCAGLWLRREGVEVTIVDRLPPGEGASFGNAGSLSDSAILPVAMPGVLRQVPRWLLDPLGPLVVRWAYLPRVLPWLARFVGAGDRARIEATAAALRALLAPIFEAYAPLVGAANCAHLIRRNGCLYVYESRAALEAGRWAMDIRRRNGCAVDEIAPDEVGQLEPALAPRYRHGVFAPDNGSTADPHGMVKALASEFVRDGGRIVRADVRDIAIGPDGPRALITEFGEKPVEKLVIAAGAWSRSLARRLGTRVPLETQRGYHATLPEPGVRVNRNIMAVSLNIMANPMAMGLRLAGTVELAGLEAPPHFERARALIERGRQLFPELQAEAPSLWMGHRPCLPDSLPVIDRSPIHRNVVFAFGHGHVGMCGAPVTGRIVRDLVLDRVPEIDVTPFRVTRF